MEGKANRGDDEDKGARRRRRTRWMRRTRRTRRTLREVVCRLVNHHALHIISWVKFK